MSAGSAPDAKTFYQAQLEMLELEDAALRRKPGAEVPRLPPGEVPRNPANVWTDVDRAPEPPVGEDEAG